MSACCPYTRSKTLTPLVNCIVNDALVHDVPNVQQTVLQFVIAVQLRLMQLLLDVATYLIPLCSRQYRNKTSKPPRKYSVGLRRDYLALRDCSYSERLQKLNLQSLELRMIHYDLTLTYQIVFGLTVAYWNVKNSSIVHVAIALSSWSSNVVVIADISLLLELSTFGSFYPRM